jgi:hypothetical protein
MWPLSGLKIILDAPPQITSQRSDENGSVCAKLFLYLINHHAMQAMGRVELQFHEAFVLALDEGH